MYARGGWAGINKDLYPDKDALIEGLAGHDWVHLASAHGAAGILEAIAAFDLHDIPKGA